jgi:hypothetical protein
MFKRIKGKGIVETEEGFSVQSLGYLTGLKFSRGDKVYFIDSELQAGAPTTVVIWEKSIRTWEGDNPVITGKPVDEATCKEIIEGIRRALAWEGTLIKLA